MFSELIHVVAGVGILFLPKAESYSIVWLRHIFFTQPRVSGRLGGFHLLVIVNNAAVIMMYKYHFETLPLILLGVSPGV